MSIFKSFGKNNEYSEYSDWEIYNKPIKREAKEDLVYPKETIVIEGKPKDNSDEKDKKVVVVQEEIIPMSSSPKGKAVHVIKESDSGIYEDKSEEKKSKFFKYEPTFKSNAIIFVIENTGKVNAHKKEILGLIKKIAKDNQTSFFTFLKIGDNKEFYHLLTYDDIGEQNIIDKLLSSDSKESVKPDYLEALNHISIFFDTLKQAFGIYKYKERKYDIQDVRMVFIGTANFASEDEENKKTLELMSSIKKFGRLKTLKYFCMEDKETINAAMMGFPIIGHIDLNFYD